MLGSASYDACAHDVALRLVPTKAANDLCRHALDDARACGSSLDPVTCIDDVKIFEDDELRVAQRCFDGPCVNHAACLRSALGPYPYTPYPPF